MTNRDTQRGRKALLFGLIAAQVVCVLFFLADLRFDTEAQTLAEFLGSHTLFEGVATLLLILSAGAEFVVLRDLMRRTRHLNHQLGLAARAMHDVMTAHFTQWGLTPAETDVALFAVKGLPIDDIARLRGSAEGTVKSQLNAIYRKAGVTSRQELLSLFIEHLLSEPALIAPAPPPAAD